MYMFNIKCKKCKKFMIYDRYLWRDNEDYYCTKCWWYKFILPMLKNKSVTKKDLEHYKAYFLFMYYGG